MTETALTRNTRTLDLLGLLSPVDSIPTSHHAAVFGQEGVAELNLNIDTWRYMGMPEQITVTIEPGNTLNTLAPSGLNDLGGVDLATHAGMVGLVRGLLDAYGDESADEFLVSQLRTVVYPSTPREAWRS